MPQKRNAQAIEVKPAMDRILTAGEFYFVHHEDKPDIHAGMVHACPCGCGAHSALWFSGQGRGRPEWNVAGEWPNVTLSPSIGIRKSAGDFHWHGYLRNGVFEEI